MKKFLIVFVLLGSILSCDKNDNLSTASDNFTVSYKGKNDACGNHRILFSENDSQRLKDISITADSQIFIGENLSREYEPDELVTVTVRRFLESDTVACKSIAHNIYPYVYVLEDQPAE